MTPGVVKSRIRCEVWQKDQFYKHKQVVVIVLIFQQSAWGNQKYYLAQRMRFQYSMLNTSRCVSKVKRPQLYLQSIILDETNGMRNSRIKLQFISFNFKGKPMEYMPSYHRVSPSLYFLLTQQQLHSKIDQRKSTTSLLPQNT